ncbi:O-methyltransferase [soil metagenome]
MSDQAQWTAVDDYLNGKLVAEEAVLTAALRASTDAGLSPINVAPNQGKLLHILALSIGAHRILEVGTLGGYSTIWMARALPADGRLISLEIDPRAAETARSNIARAGLSHLVEVRLGRALDLLPVLAGEIAEPFDLCFIDANKSDNAAYFDWSLKMTRPGGLIIIDNVVRHGRVIDAGNPDPNILGVRALMDRMAVEPRITATAIQTVGSKGYDGLAIARVN